MVDRLVGMSILETEIIFSGKIIQVNKEKVLLPDNSISDLEIIYHRGGAAVVALNEKYEICILRQYRHAVREWVWEIPAGILEKNDESILKRAQAELQEETGCSAQCWSELGEVQSSPGVFTEKIHLFLATDLTIGEQQLEQGEVLEVHWIPLEIAMAQIHDGLINDAKTCIAIFRAEKILGKNVV